MKCGGMFKARSSSKKKRRKETKESCSNRSWIKDGYGVPPNYRKGGRYISKNALFASVNFPSMLVNNELSAYLLRWYQKWSLIGCSYVPAYEGACMCRSSARSQADW